MKTKKLFVPYITCGAPSLKETLALVRSLSELGCDRIELGVPYSDPVADGAVNQASSEIALTQGVTLRDCCALVQQCREFTDIPIVLFTYFNPIFKLGLEVFAALAQQSGVSSVLVVDLPIEESVELRSVLAAHGIGYVALISPTTVGERLHQSVSAATDFIYLISRLGVTGASVILSDNLRDKIAYLRTLTPLPVVVGFGIATPEQARDVSQLADGVVVGSALVKFLSVVPYSDGQAQCLSLAKAMIVAMNEEVTQ